MQEIKKTAKTMKKTILSTLIILFLISLFSQEIGKGVWKQKYAMLVTNKQGKDYIILNKQMDANWKLVFNGKELPGKYGAPLWSGKDNAIIVLKQAGRNIVIEKLN